MRISIIAAVSENGVIGRGGKLPWHLPDDLRHFKRLTVGRHIIMGRRTLESFARPLPDRVSIVVTRRTDYHPDDVLVAPSLDAALSMARAAGEQEAFIGGGEEIYRLALPEADRMYLTIVHASVEGDTHFPEFDEDEWRVVEEVLHEADHAHKLAFSVRCYERRAEAPAS